MELLVAEVVWLSALFLVLGVLQLVDPRRVSGALNALAARLGSRRAAAATPLDDRRVLAARLSGLMGVTIAVGLLLLFRPTLFRPRAGPHPGDGSLRAIVERAVVPLLDSGKVAGLVVGIQDSGGAHVFGLGRARLDRPGEPDGNTVFEIGSITKTFTAALLARMCEAGSVRLDQPLRELLPDSVRVPKLGGREILLEDLATQRSGLPRLPGNLGFGPALLVPALADPYARYDTRSLYAFLSSHRLRRAPEAEFEYSNLGFGVLGHALERTGGASYESLVRREICDPLGMTSTRATLTPEMRGRAAQGYVIARLPPTGLCAAARAHSWSNPTLAGCGCLSSTVNDMLIYLRANLGLVSTPLAAAMDSTHRARARAGERTEIGLAWLTSSPRAGGAPVVWHNGGTGGFRSFIGFSEARRVGVVILSNSTAGVDAAGFAILKQLR